MLIDNYQRAITCLRVSVTDRCNLHCTYCSPDKPNYVAVNKLLTVSEIKKIVDAAVQIGINSIRITGGEPLMRPDLDQIIGEISGIPGISDIGITTNGILLEKYAAKLAKAGLKRVNISLDTLDQDKFKTITKSGLFNKTWNGILAAEAAGLKPIKINSVIIRDLNDHELETLASLTITHPWHIRFIEYMSLGKYPNMNHQKDKHISLQEMIEKLSKLNIYAVDKIPGTCPVISYQIPGAKGTIGFIAPIGKKFCSDCNRLRLTSDGFLRTCLLHDREIYIRDSIDSRDAIIRNFELAARIKPEGHLLEYGISPKKRRMQQIGG